MKKVVIYPGRFQPMLSHHADVYKAIQAKYPDSEVYIGTSDKVEEGSPFNFKEKQQIAQSQGIDPNKVLLAKSPYVWNFYKDYFDVDNTVVIFVVGEKDMQDDARFTFDNIDKKTGLNMKSNGTPYYYQMINTYNNENPKPMSQRGYIDVAKNIAINGDVASATTFRNAIKNAPNKETAKKIFTKHFKEYNESTFELIYNKLKGVNTMSEDLNILRQLAGLGVKENAPVEFETPLKPEKIKFAPVSKSSSVMSIANRFPAGAKVNDPEVKKEQFLKALMQSPSSLLSEINERIMPDENGLAVSKKLSEIIDSMREQGLMDLKKDDRAFVLKIVKVALKKMKLEAGDDRDFDPESGALENVDLSDIRSEYGVEEALKTNSKGFLVYHNGSPLSFSDWSYENKKEGGDGSEEAYKKYLELVKEEDISEGGDCYHCDGTDPDCEHCGGTGYVQFDDDPQEPSQDEIDAHSKDDKFKEGFDPEEFEGQIDWEGVGDDGETSPCTVSYVAKVDEMGRPVVDPKSIRIDCQMDGNSKLGFDPDFDLQMQDMDELLQACQEDADEMWDSRDNKYAHGESIEEAMCGCCGNDPCDCAPDCKGCKSMDEAVDTTVNNALDAAIQELRTLAGLNS